jgi:hypothetical protein
MLSDTKEACTNNCLQVQIQAFICRTTLIKLSKSHLYYNPVTS